MVAVVLPTSHKELARKHVTKPCGRETVPVYCTTVPHLALAVFLLLPRAGALEVLDAPADAARAAL